MISAILIFSLIGSCLGVPILQTSRGDVFEMEGNPEPGECQVCTKMYLLGQDIMNGFFRLEWHRFSELDNNGALCCAGGTNCTYGTGCNNHVIPDLANIFTTESNSSHAIFTGNVRAGGAQTSPCIPPGSLLICVPFQFEYAINDQNVNLTYQGLNILPYSLRATVRIYNWPFAAGSTGVRMRLKIMGRLMGIKNFTRVPNTNDFNGIMMEDDYNRKATVYFSKVAIVDNVTSSVTPIGPIDTEYDDNAKYIDINFPKFNNSIEYSLNLYLIQNIITTGGITTDETTTGEITTDGITTDEVTTGLDNESASNSQVIGVCLFILFLCALL